MVVAHDGSHSLPAGSPPLASLPPTPGEPPLPGGLGPTPPHAVDSVSHRKKKEGRRIDLRRSFCTRPSFRASSSAFAASRLRWTLCPRCLLSISVQLLRCEPDSRAPLRRREGPEIPSFLAEPPGCTARGPAARSRRAPQSRRTAFARGASSLGPCDRSSS